MNLRPVRAASLLLLTGFALLGSLLVSALPQPTHAQSVQSAWSAPAGAEPCAAEDLLERSLVADPGLRARRELFEQLVLEAQRKGLIPRTPAHPGSINVAPLTFVIPVAVHIVHTAGMPIGVAENLSDNQVQSQIFALNRDFANTPNNGSPAVNTGIQFCLAQNLPPGSPVVWSTTPGITRSASAQTNATYGNLGAETALKAVDYLPSSGYLNIWVVKSIASGGGGVVGWGTFPGAGPPTLDGIVIRYDCFGSNFTPYGAGFTLLPTNNDGKIMTHEVGHYLNLYHTFHNGCALPGDGVADTPPEQVNRTGCPISGLTSCTPVNDPIENFMDYTNDLCRFAFTSGQTLRMQTAITTYRAQLVSGANLIAVGCSSGFNALISAAPTQLCAGGTVQFGTPAAGPGYTYAWAFPGANPPASASTQNATATYPTTGPWTATLTVTDGGVNSSTNTQVVYVTACTPIQNTCTNWVFPFHCALSFATGMPVAFLGTVCSSGEPSAMISNSSGALLCYTDGLNVYTSSNTIMPNGSGIFCGTSSHNGTIIVKRPGSATQYFLFQIKEYEQGATPNPVNYSVIDMSLNGGLGAIPVGQKNIPVVLPGNPTTVVEGQAMIPHCNGVDWWYILNGDASSSGKIFITLVTAAGPVSTTVNNFGMASNGAQAGAITPTADGTMIAMASFSSSQAAVYTFDRSSGLLGTFFLPTNIGAALDACLSPDHKLLYYSHRTIGNVYSVRQMELATLQVRELLTGQYCGVKPGPDGKIYLGSGSSPSIHCINFPNNFNALNLNECGLNLNSISLGGELDAVFGALPNMVVQCNAGVPSAQFTYTVINCTDFTFHAVDCAGPQNWNFGDGNFGTGPNPNHVYASQGTYTVTLTVPGASPASTQQTITAQLLPVTIAGSPTVCASPNNYSVIGPAGYTYTWAASGGLPASWSGNNVDMTWGNFGGTLTLTATDAATGCTGQVVKNVGPCPVCYAPPNNMSSWWPLDEPAGMQALETVLGNTGVDINSPVHAPGKVKRGRLFDGLSNYVRVNDAATLNFGTGDMTVDAWVRTTTATGIQRIVDKRVADPEVGYGLYLKNGRVAFRLADVNTNTSAEYWSPTTPFVADGQWHHVAAVEQRAGGSPGTRLYVDGTNVLSLPPYGAIGDITNSEKLLIGAGAALLPGGPPAQYFNGNIDEVELFQRALTTGQILGIVLADTVGKCKEYCYVPSVANICKDQAAVTLTMQVCNYTTAPQSYNLSFAGLTGTGCSWPGPTLFQQLLPNPINVPANSCVPVPYLVYRPIGMAGYNSTCYQVTVTNTASNYSSICGGSLVGSRRICNIASVVNITAVGLGSPASMAFRTKNTSGGPLTVPYTISVVPADGSAAEPSGISLDGHAPDLPVAGAVTLADGDSMDIVVQAQFTEARPFKFYNVVLSMDEDGDGTPDAACATGVTNRETNTTISVPPRAETSALRLTVVPNPARQQAQVRYTLPVGGQVELNLYDIAGRRVRSLLQGARPAGPGTLLLDFSALPRGVYFLKLRTSTGGAVQRLIMVR